MVAATCFASALWPAHNESPQDALNVLRTWIAIRLSKSVGKPTFDLSRVECPRRANQNSEVKIPSDINTADDRMVELIGIEPTTSGLQNPRSPN
jgi:hypothetical protein